MFFTNVSNAHAWLYFLAVCTVLFFTCAFLLSILILYLVFKLVIMLKIWFVFHFCVLHNIDMGCLTLLFLSRNHTCHSHVNILLFLTSFKVRGWQKLLGLKRYCIYFYFWKKALFTAIIQRTIVMSLYEGFINVYIRISSI